MADVVFEEYPKSDSWVKVEHTASGFQAKNTRGFEYIIRSTNTLPSDVEEGFYCIYLDGFTYSLGNFLYVRNKEQDIKVAVRV